MTGWVIIGDGLQDILFKARLHPEQPVVGQSAAQVKLLHRTIVGTVNQAIRPGDIIDETKLHGNPGFYRRIKDNAAAGKPCPCRIKNASCSAARSAGEFLQRNWSIPVC